ncbi:MAG: hypothetical protein WBA57_15655 [Elainellaceae cyanobacterium]
MNLESTFSSSITDVSDSDSASNSDSDGEVLPCDTFPPSDDAPDDAPSDLIPIEPIFIIEEPPFEVLPEEMIQPNLPCHDSPEGGDGESESWTDPISGTSILSTSILSTSIHRGGSLDVNTQSSEMGHSGENGVEGSEYFAFDASTDSSGDLTDDSTEDLVDDGSLDSGVDVPADDAPIEPPYLIPPFPFPIEEPTWEVMPETVSLLGTTPSMGNEPMDVVAAGFGALSEPSFFTVVPEANPNF